MQLCSPTTRTLGSLLTNGVWCGQYGKPFEQALQKLYSKNRSRAGWKREWERVIVCPWLQSGVEFTASSSSFLFCSFFPHSSYFVFPRPLRPLYLCPSLLSFLRPLLPQRLSPRFVLVSSLPPTFDSLYLLSKHLSPLPSLCDLSFPLPRPFCFWNLLHTHQYVYMLYKRWFSKLLAPQCIIWLGHTTIEETKNQSSYSN